MAVRDVSFPIALVGSIALHGVLFVVAARELRNMTPAVARVPAGLVQETEPPEVKEFLGHQDSDGKATDSAPGEDPQFARLSNQEQALLSLDPAGAGRALDTPSPVQSTPGNGGAMGSGKPAPLTERIEKTEAPTPETPFGLPQQARPSEPYRPKRMVIPSPESEQESKNQTDPTMTKEQTIQTSVVRPTPEPPLEQPAERPTESSNPAPPGTPGAAASAADPIPQGKTESDAFSEEANVDVRVGKVTARTGRPHRITRPREGLAGMLDAFSSPGMTLVLRLRLSTTGDVTDVKIVRSSGSNSIDQPWKVAAYSWWFEPKKDATGRITEDSVQLTLRFM